MPLPPAEPVDFDAYADSYGEAVQRSIDFCGQDRDFFTRRKAAQLLELAHRRLGDPRRLSVLDVGCGVGVTDAHLQGRFAELQGVDTAREAVQRAAQTNPQVHYQAYEGDRLPFGDERFDLAFAICVIHHVPPGERRALARELRRVVRPGGLVVVFEHNPLNPLTRVAVSRCEFDRDAVLLSPRTAAKLAEGAGLRVVERRYVIFFPFERPRALELERRLSWLPLSAQYFVAALR